MIALDGKTFSGQGQSTNINDGYLDFCDAMRVNVGQQLERHDFKELRPVLGYGRYTHLLTFEDVAWGILVEEIAPQEK